MLFELVRLDLSGKGKEKKEFFPYHVDCNNHESTSVYMTTIYICLCEYQTVSVFSLEMLHGM